MTKSIGDRDRVYPLCALLDEPKDISISFISRLLTTPLAAGIAFWALCFALTLGFFLFPIPVSGLDGRFLPVAAVSIVIYAMSRYLIKHTPITQADISLEVDRQSPVRFLLGTAIGIVMTLVVVGTAILFNSVNMERIASTGATTILLAFALYTVLSVFEELVFRGYVLRVLLPRYGYWITQLIIALIFVAYHLAIGWSMATAVIGTSLGSLVFVAAAVATRGLAVPIGLHGGWTFSLWLFGEKTGAGVWQINVADGFNPWIGQVAFVLVGVLTAGAFYRYGLRKDDRSKGM